MPLTDETRRILTSASLDVALQRLSRSHQVVSDARNTLVAILALDVASLLGLITVVATLAAGSLMRAPGKWWIPGLALIASGAVALSGFLGRLRGTDADQGVLLARALTNTTDQDALNASIGVSPTQPRLTSMSPTSLNYGQLSRSCYLFWLWCSR